MDSAIRQALSHSGMVDITTTGRQTHQPRRLEIVYHSFKGRIYISGTPRADRRRSWLANLEADPHFTFHLKRGVSADLPATARTITDEAERREIFRKIIDTAWHTMDFETMVRHSPLIEVTFEDVAA
jgi:deazaflavin-dependent oxidoreductase (nitroreductase family)